MTKGVVFEASHDCLGKFVSATYLFQEIGGRWQIIVNLREFNKTVEKQKLKMKLSSLQWC